MKIFIDIGILLLVARCFLCEKVLQARFDRCEDPKIDALSSNSETSELFIFNGEYFYVFDVKSHTIREERIIRKYWPDVRTPIDAVSTHVENEYFVTIFVKVS
ncbi:hypothetical protein B4U80_14365 [Leptotrombidium deliense]|uniref:Uncharacterized protein n=1 Tax=Leptotrombidium deliense TaxID=299467 RepID=A0A443RWT5_9ACAR|nr:hypothetical protein B4U80_14365 [Leptotrombidium deliense]